jgi:hypothetical protein
LVDIFEICGFWPIRREVACLTDFQQLSFSGDSEVTSFKKTTLIKIGKRIASKKPTSQKGPPRFRIMNTAPGRDSC